MKKIFKYELFSCTNFSLEMPKNFKVLKLDMQYGNKTMWAEVDLDSPVEQVYFKCLCTGDEAPLGYEHIGTIMVQEDYLLHYYKEVSIGEKLIKSMGGMFSC